MKFMLYVEGWTEYETLSEFLCPWLSEKIGTHVDIHSVRFSGVGELVAELSKKVHTYANSDTAANIIGHIGLADLYGFPQYPDSVKSIKQRSDWARKKMVEKVDHPKFRMYLAVHEVEAWLLSDPSIFPGGIRRALPTRAFEEPETVNFDEPPAKLLHRLYMQEFQRGYKKRVHGKALFHDLKPQKVYEKCAHFQQMLDDMIALAQPAGL
jgi:hypothetical protein